MRSGRKLTLEIVEEVERYVEVLDAVLSQQFDVT